MLQLHSPGYHDDMLPAPPSPQEKKNQANVVMNTAKVDSGRHQASEKFLGVTEDGVTFTGRNS